MIIKVRVDNLITKRKFGVLVTLKVGGSSKLYMVLKDAYNTKICKSYHEEILGKEIISHELKFIMPSMGTHILNSISLYVKTKPIKKIKIRNMEFKQYD